jgi:hypothetical protein
MAKILLVNSHRRSGTHFLIDYLRKNVPDAHFPNHWSLPVDFNIGSLFSKDEKVFTVFKEFINTEDILIIKSHLLPEELTIENPKDKFEELIKEIFEDSTKLYIQRDGKDVLVSLYHFLNSNVSFENFIKTPNEHIPKEIRIEKEFDKNRVIYWGYHVESWQSQPDVYSIDFSDLKKNSETSLKILLKSIGLSSSRIQKPNFPKNKFTHSIQKKMNHFGLMDLPESSSVRPRKGIEGDNKNYFTKRINEFFDENVKEANELISKTNSD